MVITESPREGESPIYLGLHFPASDIPPQARALYHAVPLRVIADAADEGVPLVGKPGDPATPDLSHALLRSVSPMHLAYLRNMGVQATIAISLLVDGRLWGLIVAHDDHPHVPPQHVVHALRVICRVMGQLVASRLLALEHRRVQIDDRALLNLVERIPLTAASTPDPRTVWQQLHGDLLSWFQADGALLIHDHEPQPCTDPHAEAALACLDALRARYPETIFASASLHRDDLVASGSPVAGMLWIPLSTPGHALLVWRQESAREVFWGGDPRKAMLGADDGEALGPRRSFAKWREIRRDQSLPWTPLHLEGARRIAAQWQLLVLNEDRRRAEDTIRMLEAGILQVNDGVVIARSDPEAGLVVEFANPLFEALLHHGHPARGTAPAFLDPRIIEPAACAAIHRALARSAASQFEVRALDGRWFDIALTPVAAPDGVSGHWAVILRDVTQRRAEAALKDDQAQALQESNERYARILETSHEGILTLNDRGEIDYCNQRMLDILHVDALAPGTPFERILADPADGAELLGARLPPIWSDAAKWNCAAARSRPRPAT